mgnify:CR=1 FL=1
MYDFGGYPVCMCGARLVSFSDSSRIVGRDPFYLSGRLSGVGFVYVVSVTFVCEC